MNPPARPRPDADVDGRPALILLDEERERIAELLAELLLQALSPDVPIESAR
jgi:hypothetical protein